MPAPWTVESSRLVHADPWVVLRQERVRTGHGAVLDPFDLLELPSWVMAVPVLPDGRLVVVDQYRHAIGRVMAELPAGNCAAGEDPAAAALRELAEETGYRPLAGTAPEPLGTLWPEPARVRGTATGFLVQVDPVPAAAAPDHDEDLAVRLVPIADLLPGGAEPIVHAVQLAFLLLAQACLLRRDGRSEPGR